MVAIDAATAKQATGVEAKLRIQRGNQLASMTASVVAR